MHDHPHRVNYPLRRTRPKTDADPGWERCTWDEALDLIADKLRAVREASGPEAVAFSRGTGGATGFRATEPWFARLANHFGTPNVVSSTHVCNWARDGAAYYTFGVGTLPPPDVRNSGCIVLWGANPSATNLGLAREVIAARAGGARLVVVDPRRVGLANKADMTLQVRPGTDGALALAFISVLIDERRYDEAFVRSWTNGPLLVRDDTGRMVTAAEVAPARLAFDEVRDAAAPYLALESSTGRLVAYAPGTGLYSVPADALALLGSVEVELADGRTVTCRPAFDLLAETARRWNPDVTAEITGVSAQEIVQAVRLIAENRPVSHFLFNGVVQHTNATQTCRAIEIFYGLLGDIDRTGGNVIPPADPFAALPGKAALSPDVAAVRLGRAARPLGPPSLGGQVAAFDLYTSILEGDPYRVRALMSFGNNLLIGNADSLRGQEALQQLEFFAQAELFHTPTSRYADVLLPAADFMEAEALSFGMGLTVERRPRVVEPLYERRADAEIVFGLAERLGLADAFGDGDLSAAYDEVLVPLGLTWEGLRDQPHEVTVAAALRHGKHAETSERGGAAGFGTPSGKVELFSDRFAAYGQPALPVYEEPTESPRRTPRLAASYPVVLTNAKRPQYLHSQHRGVAAIRRTALAPGIEIHPDTAAEYGIVAGAWVMVETLRGRVRAQAEVTPSIVPGVVCGNAGWWEACEELGLAALDPFTDAGANLNLLVHADAQDPISGALPHRSSLCRLVPLDVTDAPDAHLSELHGTPR